MQAVVYLVPFLLTDVSHLAAPYIMQQLAEDVYEVAHFVPKISRVTLVRNSFLVYDFFSLNHLK